MRLRRPDGSLLVSLAIHVVLGAGLVHVLGIPHPLRSYFAERVRAPQAAVERITFIDVPPPPVPPTPGRAGGNGIAGSSERAEPLVAPPTATPSAIAPVAPRSGPSTVGEGTGPLVGGGGPTRGIRPSYSDPRVWEGPAPIIAESKTPTERLDSVFARRLADYEDSIAAIAGSGPRRAAGDWTVEKDGKKYGVDQRNIHLGSVRIPTALLALLPLNKFGPDGTMLERERAMNAMSREIAEQAQRAMNEEEFRKAVKGIRERKERERARQREQERRVERGAEVAAESDAKP